MILTKDEILKEIKNGRIVITPFNKKQIGPASIDLSLGDEFRVVKKYKKPIEIREKTNLKNLGKLIKTKKYILKAGEFVQAITKEKIKLPEDICGLLMGRSRFARAGLAIHATAAFIQPGINNKQVLEIKNLSQNDLVLYSGEKICQLILIRTLGKAKYKGKFRDQISP